MHGRMLSWVDEGAEDEETVVVKWEEFKFAGPAGERCLMPIKGSSMDVLARTRRGSLDHVVPNLDTLLHSNEERMDEERMDEDSSYVAAPSSASATYASAPSVSSFTAGTIPRGPERPSVGRAPTVGRIESAPPPTQSKPESAMCTLL